MNDERHFLHDLVGPLSTGRNLIEILIEQLKDASEPTEHIQTLELVLKSLDRAADLLRDRRELLYKAED